MPKPKKEQITIRVLPQTIGAINELADRNGITKGDALDLLVLSGLAARAKVAKESAPKPEPPKSTGPLRCSTKGCGSYAVNPEHHGRTYGVDLDLCDVCYWRKRAPEPRPISEAPKDGRMVLICLPDHDPQWTIGVFDPRKRWVDCLAILVVEPTHFLPLPPEVR